MPSDVQKDPEMDWRLSWTRTNGKTEEYIFSDLGPAMRGFNETVASWTAELVEIKLDRVTKR